MNREEPDESEKVNAASLALTYGSGLTKHRTRTIDAQFASQLKKRGFADTVRQFLRYWLCWFARILTCGWCTCLHCPRCCGCRRKRDIAKGRMSVRYGDS